MLQKLANDAMNYLSALNLGMTLAALAVLALVIGIAIKLSKKFGIIPIFLAIALLAGAYFAGTHNAKPPIATVAPPPTAEPVAEKRGILANLVGKVTSPEGATRVKDSWEQGDSRATCGYCKAFMIIGGRKGTDTIRCPECGATMPAQKAIWYHKLIEQRGY